MATSQTIQLGGGRSSGAASFVPDAINTSAAINAAVNSAGAMNSASAQTQPSDYLSSFRLPDLNADLIDQLFAGQEARRAAGLQRRQEDFANTDMEDPFQAGVAAMASRMLDPNRLLVTDPNVNTTQIGWDLGQGGLSGIYRGSQALGISSNPSEWTAEQASQVSRLAGVDFSGLSGQAKIDAQSSALGNIYRVAGAERSVGNSSADARDLLSAFFVRDGSKLTQTTQAQRFEEPKKASFWDDFLPALAWVATPLIGASGALAAGGAAAGAVSGATGLSSGASSVLLNSALGGAMSSLSGGDFLTGALRSAVGGAGTGAAAAAGNSIFGTGTTGANLLGAAGKLGTQAILNNGQISPLALVGAVLGSLGGTGKTKTAKGA